MVSKNIRLFLPGSEDFTTKAKLSAAQDLNLALEAGWPGLRLPNEFHFQRLLGLTNLRTSGAARAGCRHPVNEHPPFSAIVEQWPTIWDKTIQRAINLINSFGQQNCQTARSSCVPCIRGCCRPSCWRKRCDGEVAQRRRTLRTVQSYIASSEEHWCTEGPRRAFGIFDAVTKQLIGSIEAKRRHSERCRSGKYLIRRFPDWRGKGIAQRALDLMRSYPKSATGVRQMASGFRSRILHRSGPSTKPDCSS
jgi:hypothetical protein